MRVAATAVVFIANRVAGDDDVRHVERMLGEKVFASIPADEGVAAAERIGVAPIDHAPGLADDRGDRAARRRDRSRGRASDRPPGQDSGRARGNSCGMTDDEPAEDDRRTATRPRTVVLIGDGDLSDETARALEASNARVRRLRQPDEDDVREALEDGRVDSVAVVERSDAIVLRMALMVRAVSKDIPLLLTIFDSTIAEQVGRVVPNTR